MGATATLKDQVLAVEPGGEARTEVRVRNDGAVVDQFTLDVVGAVSGWAAVEPPVLSLFPGAEQTAQVTFRPARVSTTLPGQVPFGVRVRSKEDPAGSTVEEGTLEVAAFLEPFAEIVPRTSRGSRSGSHEIAIDNRGNARLNAEIAGSDPDQLLAFDIRPPGVVVEPGAAGFARVRVKPTRTFLRGPNKTLNFALNVVAPGAQPITLNGTLLQEAVLPPWFLKAASALVAALVGVVLFWLLVLRPSIENAANQAVEKPLAALTSGVNSALAAGGLPTVKPAGGGGGAPSPSPTAAATSATSTAPSGSGTVASPPAPSPTAAGIVIPGLGTPIDGRLDRTVQTFKVKGTVFLTDLVFGNPNGRVGTIALRRNNTILLTLRLENFRDLDFHFVTPIALSDGQSLVLNLTCEGVATVEDCDPSVFYSGYARAN